MSAPADLLIILDQALQAAARSDTDARVLAGKNAATRFSAVLDEIEETVLPRTLSFAIGDAQQLVVEAGDGRLRGLCKVVPDTLRDPSLVLLPELGGGPRSKRVELLKSVLTRFAEADGELSVRSSPPMHLKGNAFNGLAVSDLDPSRPVPKAETAAEDKAEAPEPKVEEPAKVQAEAPTAPPEPEPTPEPEPAPKAAPAPVAEAPAEPPPEQPAKAAEPAKKDQPAPASSEIPDTLPGAFFLATQAFALTRAVTAPGGGLAGKAGDDRDLPLEFLARSFLAQIQMNAPFMDIAMPGPKAIIMGTQAADMPSVCCLVDDTGLAITTVDNSTLGAVLATAAAAIAASQED